MSRSRAPIGFGLVLLAWAATAPATGQERAVFRTAVDVVPVDVCVTDRSGRFVGGLTPTDFVVLDNGTPRPVAFFAAEGHVPLAVALLVDRSASMTGTPIIEARRAAVDFIRMLQPQDLVEVVAFNQRADVRFPLGRNHEAAIAAVQTLATSGHTGLYEALLVSTQRLSRDAPREYRKALVLLSDGEDTTARLTLEDVLPEIRRSGVMVYALSLRADREGRSVPVGYNLVQLATDTGGRAAAVGPPTNLAAMYAEIAVELRHLYRLGIEPTGVVPDGSWRRLSVHVPGRDLRVRARAGYVAPAAPRRWMRDGRRR